MSYLAFHAVFILPPLLLLAALAPAGEIPIEGAVFLNDVAAHEGSVYVTDSAQGAIYVLDPGAASFRLLVRDRAMSFPNGIVFSPDERLLYVAHIEGISIIDPASGRRTASGHLQNSGRRPGR